MDQSSKEEATKQRIITHMNADHQGRASPSIHSSPSDLTLPYQPKLTKYRFPGSLSPSHTPPLLLQRPQRPSTIPNPLLPHNLHLPYPIISHLTTLPHPHLPADVLLLRSPHPPRLPRRRRRLRPGHLPHHTQKIHLAQRLPSHNLHLHPPNPPHLPPTAKLPTRRQYPQPPLPVRRLGNRILEILLHDPAIFDISIGGSPRLRSGVYGKKQTESVQRAPLQRPVVEVGGEYFCRGVGGFCPSGRDG